jgi:hypothetical protein
MGNFTTIEFPHRAEATLSSTASTGLRKRYYPLQHRVIRGMLAEMGRQVAVVLYVVAMAAVIVGVDFVFFRNRFWERLTVNIGIVLLLLFILRLLYRRGGW